MELEETKTRTEPGSHQKSAVDSSTLGQLLGWLAENEIKVSKNVGIKQNLSSDSKEYSGAGFGIIAKKGIRKGEIICEIPKGSVLSIKNTAISSELPKPESRLEHHLLLAVSLLYEKSQGKTSPWFEYIQSLPDSQLCGIQIDLNECKGTSLYYTLQKYKKDIREAWLKLSQKLKVKDLDYSWLDIQNALSLVTSRSFSVDPFHDDAFVPLADIFNHNSKGEHVHLEADVNVCVYCGFKFCDCYLLEDREENMSDDQGASQDGTLVEESNQDEGSASEGDEDDIMEIVAVKSCQKGKEVFNTFGQHSNSELFTRYGFAERDNPNDEAIVHEKELRHVLGPSLFLKAKKLYMKWEDDIMDVANMQQDGNNKGEEDSDYDISDDLEGQLGEDHPDRESNTSSDTEASKDFEIMFVIRDGVSTPLRMFIHATLLSLPNYRKSMIDFDHYLKCAARLNNQASKFIQRILRKRKSFAIMNTYIKIIQDYEVEELKLFSKSLLERK